MSTSTTTFAMTNSLSWIRMGRLVGRIATAIGLLLLPRIAFAAVFDGGGIEDGLGAAGGVDGIAKGTLPDFIATVLERALTYVTVAAVIVIIVAGFRLILSNGDDAAKDTAKKTIYYTGAGLVVIYFAQLIVDFFASAGEVSVIPAIQELLERALNYASILGVVFVVIAGFRLVLSNGDDTAKDTSKKTIYYVGAGLLIMYFAEIIVSFFASAAEVDVHGPIVILLNRIVLYLAILAVIMVVGAGIRMILSNGDETAKDTAKKTIWYVLSGLIIVFFARTIVVFVLTLPAAG